MGGFVWDCLPGTTEKNGCTSTETQEDNHGS